MKTSQAHHPRTNAFTLLELLVVITIIATLAGLLFPALQGAMTQAHRAKARTVMASTVTALSAYHTEYGSYPNLGTVGADTFVITDNHRLFNILRAKETGSPVQNTRQVPFFTYRDARGAKLRDGYDPTGNLLDPWGFQYRVKYDTDYSKSVTAYGKDLEMDVVAWSPGRDGVEVVGHTDLKGADDVVSF